MRLLRLCLCTLVTLCVLPLLHGAEPTSTPALPELRMEEIAKDLTVGYAVLLVDLNADKKLDIVVVDTERVIWYENPSWKRRTICEKVTKKDNVCLAAHDIDGDGQLDIALGADWVPFVTEAGRGTLQWFKRGKTLDEPWQMYAIDTEPTVHRIRFADLDGDGKAELLLGPLMGRNSTKAKNFMDGLPVRMLAYKIPADPTKDRWVPEVMDESLHVVHNFIPVPAKSGKGHDVLTASYEGVSLLTRQAQTGKWSKQHIGAGNQATPEGNRGASEIKQGKLKNGKRYIATVEPWHGHQIVVYTEPDDAKQTLWNRHVIDEELKWGHAVWCADFDGDGSDELIIGVRDNLSTKPGQKSGVRLYQALDEKGTRWGRKLVDEGGVAVEDLAAGDLNGDGKIDLVAVGRATKNVRIYWNEAKK